MSVIDKPPKTFKEAMERPDFHLWLAAMIDKINSIAKHGVWKQANCPTDKNVVECQWVLTYKRGPNGKIVQYKAQLVAKGYSQRLGIDFNKVSSPVAASNSYQVLLSKVANQNLKLLQLNIKTAFLHGNLDKEIYMEQPEGFATTITTIMDLGEAQMFVRVKITRDQKAGTLKISQRQYIDNVLKRFGMEDCKPCITPMAELLSLPKYNSPSVDRTLYQQGVGSLMYGMISTWPDIAYATGLLAQHAANPGKEHWSALLQVLQYLQATKDLGIVYNSSKNSELIGFVDADYAGDPHTSWSTTGWTFILAGGAIAWSLRKQPTISLLSTEAKYVAAASAAQEILWIRSFLSKLVPTLSTITSRTPPRSSSRASTHAGQSYPTHPMATRSRPPSQARSPINQGELGSFIPPASPELGKVSLKRVIRLLWGLQSQVDRIERTLLEQAKVSQEVQTNVKNILQTVDVVKDGLAQLQSALGPHTPEEQKPPAVKETPRAAPKAEPVGKAQPFLGAPAPIISTGAPRRDPLSLFNPYPSSSFPSGPAPAPQGPPPVPIITLAQPPAPSTVKVDHPDAFKGKIGLEAKQWLTRMLAWVCLNQRQFPLDLEVLSFLLMNMTEAGGAWAHPHLDQLGSHRALIQTVDEFKIEFLAAFGNPDATRAAERKITSLTQTGTCAKYITKFRTLQMELDWNDAALCGQFARGLHWEVQRQIATRERQPRTLRELQDAALIINNALWEERASHLQQGNKPSKTTTTPNRGTSTGQQATKTGPLSSNPNYVSEEERNRRRTEGLCVKCGRAGHKFAECWTGWKATPKEDKGKAKEIAKIGKDSEYQLGKE
ncbi:Retrotransposon-derived protein PEG10 [Rhizoctonia solani]|uniref:Retrotransposon-derived protein PEG10 n=1 Tax=Rhizoctonia solani TaxID=456999 RepID=A0A8H8SZW4_9AGAM|nr:Retrotransposon-derived protein PEG10 [Rhizoctonia solani]QRW24746.1 Retrotransposon-derived protein PEG10 [Rhizoctonia solani]